MYFFARIAFVCVCAVISLFDLLVCGSVVLIVGCTVNNCFVCCIVGLVVYWF